MLTISLNICTLLILIYINIVLSSICLNDCSNNGRCNSFGQCECFSPYKGLDCSNRQCPLGKRLIDIPNNFDEAHSTAECSGQGLCLPDGTCECAEGFSGTNCARLGCLNACSGRGECLSLKQAANTNDGYLYNRTTSYTLWDSEIIYGCKCDSGWTGFDCSQRTCELGVDPRLRDYAHETVTLRIICPEYGCSGLFQLRIHGVPVPKWFSAKTLNSVLATELMTAGKTYTNNAAHSIIPISAVDNNGCNNCTLGSPRTTTRTSIRFSRQAGDVPALSIFTSLLAAGSITFETKQILQCNCVSTFCHGTFRVSFDGVLGSTGTNINPKSDDGTIVVNVLNNLETVKSAGLKVSLFSGSGTPICVSGQITNHTFLFEGSLGNAPTMGIWSSIVPATNPATFSSEDSDIRYSSSILHVYNLNNGRNDALKICSGIGTCNYATSQCECPEGWSSSANTGPCNVLSPVSSDYDGLQTCPGLAWSDRPEVMITEKDYLKSQRLYLSVNHITTPSYRGPTRSMVSTIESFDWDPDTFEHSLGRYSRLNNAPILNLTTSASAGPIVADKIMNRLYFVDNRPDAPFIGYMNLNSTTGEYKVLCTTVGVVSSLIFDSHFKRRRLYWSITGTVGVADGSIYYTIVDNNGYGLTATVYSLVSIIGQSNLIDPTGIAIHYIEKKLYWLDVESTSSTFGIVLRSISLPANEDDPTLVRNSKSLLSDYSNLKTSPLLGGIQNLDGTETTISKYSSEGLLLLFEANNTAVFADVSANVKIIGTNLNRPHNATKIIPTTSNDYKIFEGYYRSKHLVNISESTFKTKAPRHFAYDPHRKLLIWSDSVGEAIFISRYPYRTDEPLKKDPLRNRIIYVNPANSISYPSSVNTSIIFPRLPVGIYLDKGSPNSIFEQTVDCYGNGYCNGIKGNWECTCFDDSNSGNTQGNCNPISKQCPMNYAWFHKPIVNERAHDEVVECSNMGVCNRLTGECQCRIGFEGSSCERMECPGKIALSGRSDDYAPISGAVPCHNSGRCVSLKNLARYSKSTKLQYFTDPNNIPTAIRTDDNGNSIELSDTYSSYGTIPNKAATWDGNRIQGCLADEYGYVPTHTMNDGNSIATTSNYNAALHSTAHNMTAAIGRDLSKRECPYSYDPIYLRNRIDIKNISTIQSLQCLGNSGKFILSFRNSESIEVTVLTVKIKDLKNILQSMTTIGLVNIIIPTNFVETDLLCNLAISAPIVKIEFLTEFGKLPLITMDKKSTISGNSFSNIYITEVRGYIENSDTKLIECSGHGYCDYDSGLCKCFKNWLSSDGFGNIGTIGDCGHFAT